MAEARRHLRFEPDRGWALFDACTHRDDFFDLRIALLEPWVSEVRRRRVDGLRTVARVVARRNQIPEVDLTLARDAGVALWTLTELSRATGEVRGRLTLFKAVAIDVEPRAGGFRVTFAEVDKRVELPRDERYISQLIRGLRYGRGYYHRWIDRRKIRNVERPTGSTFVTQLETEPRAGRIYYVLGVVDRHRLAPRRIQAKGRTVLVQRTAERVEAPPSRRTDG